MNKTKYAATPNHSQKKHTYQQTMLAIKIIEVLGNKVGRGGFTQANGPLRQLDAFNPTGPFEFHLRPPTELALEAELLFRW